jgi:hypothetical protein
MELMPLIFSKHLNVTGIELDELQITLPRTPSCREFQVMPWAMHSD